MSTPHDSTPSVEALRTAWEERARSALGHFFVASHVGHDDPKTWRSVATRDAGLALTGVAPEFLRRARFLEIGCGVGRLVPEFAPQVAQYTGIDLSATYLAEAKEAGAPFANTRFFEAPGDGLPAALQGEQFDAILAFAVFIHCPKPVIEAVVASALGALADGGWMRFQILIDPADPHGYPAAPPAAAEPKAAVAQRRATPEEKDPGGLAALRQQVIDEGLLHLIEERPYKGHSFGYAEALEVFTGLAGGRPVHLFRQDALLLNVHIGR